MKDGIETFIAIAIFAITFTVGWVISASLIGHECKKLGQFYVGDTVYLCELKKGSAA